MVKVTFQFESVTECSEAVRVFVTEPAHDLARAHAANERLRVASTQMTPTTAIANPELRALLSVCGRPDNQITAVKCIRALTGCTLKEAKDYIESIHGWVW